MRAACAIVASALLCISSVASAETDKADSRSWWQRLSVALDEAAAPYKIAPPTPVMVRWHPRQIWSGELAGTVVDMLGVDLGDDGKSELVVLTSDELVVFSRVRGLFDVRMKADLPPKLSTIRPRDAMGSLSVEHLPDTLVTIRARSSERALGGTYQLEEGKLRQVGDFRGYPTCRQTMIQAAPYRNYFLGSRITWQLEEDPTGAQQEKPPELADALYSLRCSQGLVDPNGRAVEYMSAASAAGELQIFCKGDDAHCRAQERIVSEVGDAHLVSDVDHDGLPEIIHSARNAPGEADSVVVIGKGPPGSPPVFARDFGGGVVAIAAGDFAGDGALEVVVAVRKRTSKRVTLWLLN